MYVCMYLCMYMIFVIYVVCMICVLCIFVHMYSMFACVCMGIWYDCVHMFSMYICVQAVYVCCMSLYSYVVVFICVCMYEFVCQAYI